MWHLNLFSRTRVKVNSVLFNDPKYWDRQVCANSDDPYQKLQNAASDQGLHCLPLIQQFIDKSISSKVDLFKLLDKCGKVRCPNIKGKYGTHLCVSYELKNLLPSVKMSPSCSMGSRYYWVTIFTVTLVLLNPAIPCFCKQCRSRSVGLEANWSGSALFAIQYMNLCQQSGSSNMIGWKLEVGVAS